MITWLQRYFYFGNIHNQKYPWNNVFKTPKIHSFKNIFGWKHPKIICTWLQRCTYFECIYPWPKIFLKYIAPWKLSQLGTSPLIERLHYENIFNQEYPYRVRLLWFWLLTVSNCSPDVRLPITISNKATFTRDDVRWATQQRRQVYETSVVSTGTWYLSTNGAHPMSML